MNSIKIKLLGSWVESLGIAYFAAIQHFAPEDDHEHLLLECAREMLVLLDKQIKRDQHKCTLTLTSVQALAFLQFWMLVPLERGSLAAEVVRKMMHDIDRTAKQPKRLVQPR